MNIDKYLEPVYGLKHDKVKFNKKSTAFVIIDPQIDFLSEKGVMWPVIGENLKTVGTVRNLDRLFQAAEKYNLNVIISPHYYYDHDYKWAYGGPGEHFMHDTKMFYKKAGAHSEIIHESGADWLPQYKKYINSRELTTVASPHKIFGPQTNDVVLQLRKRKINTIILAGMAANLCVESHLRDLVEQGFEVVVVKDATAGPQAPEGDGYHAALINYRYIANEIITTDDLLRRLEKHLKNI
ncbi:cysteine hydrolase [Mycoplasmopsis agassizii]|nr:cysteine hydrolase [Mycoplasmopsis agassizii]SMC17240.1 Nicotinamidase-related amidase [Mycoplasmopsis agassizii]